MLVVMPYPTRLQMSTTWQLARKSIQICTSHHYPIWHNQGYWTWVVKVMLTLAEAPCRGLTSLIKMRCHDLQLSKFQVTSLSIGEVIFFLRLFQVIFCTRSYINWHIWHLWSKRLSINLSSHFLDIRPRLYGGYFSESFNALEPRTAKVALKRICINV